MSDDEPASTSLRARVRDHRWLAAVTVALAVLFGTWAIGMPRFAAPDEVAHTIKAYGTAHGEAVGDAIPGISPLTRLFDAPTDLADDGQACFAFDPNVTAACAPLVTDPALQPIQTSAATYPPAYYAVVGGVTRLTGSDHSVRAYRVVSIAMVVVLLALAAAVLARLGRGRPALLLLALTPMAVFMSASVNPTAIEIAGTLLLWAYVAALAAGPAVATPRQLLVASTIAGAVVLVRPVALPWVAIALVAYGVVERRPLAADRRSLVRLVARSAWPLAVAVVLSAAWSRYAGVGLTDDKFLDRSATVDVFRAGLGRTSELFEQAIGILGWLDTTLPFAVVALSVVGLVAACTVVVLHGDRRARLLLAAFGAIWVMYPALYVTAAKTPLVWQGRYNLPLLGGLVLCLVVAGREWTARPVMLQLSSFVAAAFVAIEGLAFHQTLRRFMVGYRGSLLLRSPSWHPETGAWVLIVINVAAAAALATLLLRSPEPTRPAVAAVLADDRDG